MRNLLTRLTSHRLGRNLTAHVFNQIVTITIQLATIPILIKAWGVQTYGAWLVLTAIPQYLAFADLGFTTIAKNEIARLAVGGNKSDALSVFQSIFWMLTVAGGALLLATGVILHFLPIGGVFSIGPLSDGQARIILLSQIAGVVAYQFFYLFCAGIRSEGYPATETTLAALLRASETMVLLSCALEGINVAAAAFASVLVRIIATLLLPLWLMRIAPWLHIGLSNASFVWIRRLFFPSLTYTLVPLTTAFVLQGPIIILGANATAVEVALYSTARTVTRIGVAGANLVTQAFLPEYSFARGRRDSARTIRLIRMQVLILTAGMLAYVCTLVWFGPEVIHILSHSQLQTSGWLLLFLAAAAIAEMVWSSLFGVLTVMNAHSQSALWYVLIVGIGAVSALVLRLSAAEPLAGLIAVVQIVIVLAIAREFVAFCTNILGRPQIAIDAS
ncbi:hypothetical protein ACM43_04880 [Bradyrhizobium sp. CCBAU 45321]|uniref:lipopolysaccharide biosynthesis protein n=1 Tax=Bradyrhizobium sp. CCBAU 45321 TaxID=1641878 RepID=UPI002303571B|nr:hypothetical protein [Bradyrhizobium sp. CCBAU 45321]MDA9543897.1 hypothetical protein [Bradyrhizobium sp. CCBAU 45321]